MVRVTLLGLIFGLLIVGQQSQPNSQSGTAWPQEPEGFLGIPFNASHSEAQSKMNLGDCLPVSGVQQCLATLHLGDYSFDGIVEFKDDKFVNVFSSVSAPMFGALKDIFIARYGRPLQDEITPGSANNGSGYEILSWSGKRVSVTFKKTALIPGKAVFQVALKSFLDEEKQAREAQLKKATDALK
jgi:hypothetical protein